MTDEFDKIRDRARRLIGSRFAERRQTLPDEINRILQKMQLRGMLHSSPAIKAVRSACEQEIRTKAGIAWDSIQDIHKALGSPITMTLAADLSNGSCASQASRSFRLR